MKVIIPAREGSKGLSHKNRKLLKYTLDTIPDDITCVVATDDMYIKGMVETEYGDNITVLWRPVHVSTDTSSTKQLMSWALEKLDWDHDDVAMLYLTYPQRTWEHVELAYKFFKENGSTSLLCRKELEQSPFLMLKEEEGKRGSQLFYHDKYRRQDYPKCFEISHYISIFRACSINKLNNNLYNNDTVFFPIDDVIDVDEEKDFDRFLNER